jgi:hypothetical protein
MKTLLVIFFLVPNLIFGQKNKPDASDPYSLPEKRFGLEVKRIAPGEIKLPFASIQIIDNRFDTSKLGFAPAYQVIANKRTVGRKIVFEDGVARTLENYYNEVYQNAFTPGDITLLIVLKKFWFSGIDDEKNREIDILRNEHAMSFLYCKWEYYFKKGDVYMPVQRVDTVLNGVEFEATNNRRVYGNNKKLFKLILNGMIEVFDFNKFINNIERLPKKNWTDIQRYNASYFDIPVLKDTILQKGVYITFNDFKNNRPSVINFTEQKMRIRANTFENYIEDDKGNRITNYWGYCTGETLKIGKYGNEKVHRRNNTFEFFVQHPFLQINTNIIGGPTYTDRVVWIPYQIDMETGNIY